MGPSFEIGIGDHFGVEANALYSRFGSRAVLGHPVEFPVLGKFYFSPREPAVPFVSGGFAFRNIWLDNQQFTSNTESAVGAVFGGGAGFKLWVLKLAPEVRYTRWDGYNFPATNPNQVQALPGIHC